MQYASLTQHLIADKRKVLTQKQLFAQSSAPLLQRIPTPPARHPVSRGAHTLPTIAPFSSFLSLKILYPRDASDRGRWCVMTCGACASPQILLLLAPNIPARHAWWHEGKCIDQCPVHAEPLRATTVYPAASKPGPAHRPQKCCGLQMSAASCDRTRVR